MVGCWIGNQIAEHGMKYSSGVAKKLAVCELAEWGAIRLLVATFVTGVAMPQGPAPVPALETVPALRDWVKRQEESVLCVAGSAYVTRARFAADSSEQGLAMVLDFVHETDPLGRSLLDYKHWEGAATDGRLFHESKVLGYDGRISWMLRRSTQLIGRDDSPMQVSEAVIEHRRADVHAIESANGLYYTMLGFYQQRKARFSEVLSRGEVPFELAAGPGEDAVTLSCVSRSGSREQWVLRRSWAYGLRTYQKWTPSGSLIDRMEVVSAKQIDDIFWYPENVVSTKFRNEARVAELNLDIADARLLRVVPEATFQPLFPHGTVVTDRTTGTTVRLAAPDSELQASLDEQSDRMRQLIVYEPGVLPSSPMQRTIAVVGLSMASVLSWLVWRRRSPRGTSGRLPARGPRNARGMPSILLAGLAWGAVAGATPAQMPLPLQQLRQVADNCALNCVALAARYFGVGEPLAETASRLDCGEGRVDAVDMDRMRTAVQQYGLDVQGYRHARLPALLDECRRRRGIAIVHVATGGPVGHYYMLAPSAVGVVVVNPGYSVRQYDVDSEVLLRLESQATGNALVVSRSEVRARWLLGSMPDWTLEIGAIGAEERTESMAVENDTHAGISLLSASSSCGCFLDAHLSPPNIPAGGEGLLRLRIRGSSLGTTVSRQMVQLRFGECDGSSAKRSGEVGVNRTLTIEASRRREHSSVLPAVVPSLALGRLATPHGASVASFATVVTVIVPTGGRVAGWQSNHPVEVLQQSVEVVGDAVGIQFRIAWQHLEDSVVFDVLKRDGTTTPVLCRLRAPTNHENTTPTEVR
jgi:hypothetical protein